MCQAYCKERVFRVPDHAESTSWTAWRTAATIEFGIAQHAILVMTRCDWQEIGPSEWQAFLLLCARRRG
jgi:hypothetical protein